MIHKQHPQPELLELYKHKENYTKHEPLLILAISVMQT